MDTFRHPSQMRFFIIFSLLLLASTGLKRLLTIPLSKDDLIKLKKYTWIFTTSIFVVLIIALTQSALFRHMSELKFSELRITIKNIIDNLSFSDGIVISALVQLFFLFAFLLLIKKSLINKRIFIFLWITNMFIMAQFLLPATFVSKTSPKEINAIIHAAPKGFPISGLEKSITENSNDALANFDKIALSYFYNKKIGISRVTNSPSFLTEQAKFINNRFLYQYVSSLPVAYIADSLLQLKDSLLFDTTNNCQYAFTADINTLTKPCNSNDTVIFKRLTANSIEMETQNLADGMLVLTQNYHHNWLASIDGVKATVHKTNMSFMGIKVPAGKHSIVFRFVPDNTIKAIWVMLASLFLLFTTWIVSLFRQKRFNRQ
jgi:hypothetical protein